MSPDGVSPGDLLPQVLVLTEPYLGRGFVALYAHGSVVTGEMDHWSDLDLCVIREDDALPALREWNDRVDAEFGHALDPMAAPIGQLGADGDWHVAVARCVLHASGRLLLGEDVRDRIAPATPYLIGLTAANTGVTWLRRFLDLFRIYHLPERVDDLPAVPLEYWPFGNAAYQAAMGTLQLLRALAETRTGVFNSRRSQLVATVAELRPDLHPWALKALAARQRYPRYEPVEADAPDLRELLENIPALGQMLLDQMAELGLPDPTYEGMEGSYYNADGSVKEHRP